MIIDNNFGNLRMKKRGLFQKERISFFFQSSMEGGVDPRNPPVRTPLAIITILFVLFRSELHSGLSLQLVVSESDQTGFLFGQIGLDLDSEISQPSCLLWTLTMAPCF